MKRLAAVQRTSEAVGNMRESEESSLLLLDRHSARSGLDDAVEHRVELVNGAVLFIAHQPGVDSVSLDCSFRLAERNELAEQSAATPSSPQPTAKCCAISGVKLRSPSMTSLR